MEVPLTGGGVALLDDEDAWILRIFPKWQIDKRAGTDYAKRGSLRMHRLVAGLDMDGFSSPGIVDHINGNGLDNRRSNLRICTHAQNLMNRGASKTNRTGLRGVTAHRKNSFRARIRVHGKLHDLGCFRTAEEAGAAYDAAARQLHGEFYRAR